MEQDEPAFKPQWLTGTVRTAGAASLWGAPSPRTDYQAKGSSSRNPSSVHDRHHSSRQSSSRKSSGSNGSRRPERDGMGKSKGYANFGRNRERDREKKDFDSGDSESRPVAGDRHVFKSFGTCRPERDRLNRARSKPDPWSNKLDSLNNGSTSRSSANVSSSSSSDVVSLSENNAIVSTPRSNTAVSISVSNAAVSNTAISTSRSNAVGIAFEREFPQLSSEDKHGRQGFKVRSPGISTPLQNVPLINASDGWNSVLADIPLLNDRKKSPASSLVLQSVPSKQTESVPNSGTALSMAETVMQAPLRISIGPQLSIEAQKIEERTLRQYTLRPLTPPASKSSVLGSKTRTTRIGDPGGTSKSTQQLKIHSANGSVRAPLKTDISKRSQSVCFQVLSREQNGTAHTSKDCTSNPVSPPAPLALIETQKKPVAIQTLKIATHELPLPLQGPCGDKKSNARDKHKFFEMLRTKSSNGSSTTFESVCQSCPSSLVDVKQDPSLNLQNDFSLFHSGMKCMGNGKCFCEEANSSEGSQIHLSDTEENISCLKSDITDRVSQQLLLEQKREADTSSEPADAGDEEFQLSLSDSADGSSSSAPLDSDDGCNRLQSGNEEASSSSEATEPEDEEHPAEPPPEDKPFLISLGWREDEIVQPLDFEEIADSVKGCAELEKKLWSMESNANIKVILSILGRAK